MILDVSFMIRDIEIYFINTASASGRVSGKRALIFVNIILVKKASEVR